MTKCSWRGHPHVGRVPLLSRIGRTVTSDQNEGVPIVPILMTVEEIASLFRVSRRAVYQWRDRGMLPSIKTPGRGIRFKRADVEAILNGAPK